jgi:type IV pilus assembly protein PilE
MQRLPRGFTLIELMIVVLVAAILVGIAVPSYQSQIRHSRRTDAKTAVLDAAVREEKYHSLSNSYTTTAANLGYSALPTPVGSNFYTLNVCVGTATTSTAGSAPCTATTGASGTSFVVSAVPIPGTSQAGDVSCSYYAVDNTGTMYSADSTAGSGNNTTSLCWQ